MEETIKTEETTDPTHELMDEVSAAEFGETTEGEAEETTNGAGRKKHARPIAYLMTTDAEGNSVQVLNEDGNPILAEKLWANVTLAAAEVREFMQFCRDTNRKPSDVTGEILRAGMAPILAEVQSTKEARDAARPAKTAGSSDPAKLEAQTAKLVEQQKKLEEKLAAIRARAAALKGGTLPNETPAPEEGDGVAPTTAADILNQFPTPEPVTPEPVAVPATPAPIRKGKR